MMMLSFPDVDLVVATKRAASYHESAASIQETFNKHPEEDPHPSTFKSLHAYQENARLWDERVKELQTRLKQLKTKDPAVSNPMGDAIVDEPAASAGAH
jgi:hypothetical protein